LCSHCNTSHSFALVPNRFKVTDKQLVELQESPDYISAGQTPHIVVLYGHRELVDPVQPGFTVTGVYRAVPQRSYPKMRNQVSVYKSLTQAFTKTRMSIKKFLSSNMEDFSKTGRGQFPN
jgi:DNA replication licensing factor MCM4